MYLLLTVRVNDNGKLGFGQAFMLGIIIIIVGTLYHTTRPLGGGMIGSVLTCSMLTLAHPEVGFDARIHDSHIHKDPALIESCFDSACVHWKDTDGNRIEAHAAGMLQVCHYCVS